MSMEETLLVSGNRLFQLLVVSGSKTLDKIDIDRFFESFRIAGDAKEWKRSRTKPNAVVDKREPEPSQVTQFVTAFQCPAYPPEAKKLRLAGIVKMQVTTDGNKITDLKVIGHPVLSRAAEENIRTWKFASGAPTLFTVQYFYEHEAPYAPDPVYHCGAKLHLPEKVEVSTDW